MALGKGKAAHSVSGASMSKYDVEVESRLKKLEAIAHENCGTGGGDADLAERLDIIEAVLRKIPTLSYERLSIQEKAERG
jgi:hypothetical protein